MSPSHGLPVGGAALLDTCAVLDLSVSPEQVIADVRAWLADPMTDILVSAVSAWEIAIKTRMGKLVGGERITAAWEQNLIELQATSLDIDATDAIRAGGLTWTHRDPFDRMLVAQALRLNLPIITSDRVVIDAGLVRTIATR